MCKSVTSYLLLSVLLISSLVFSCKTRRTPIINAPSTGSYGEDMEVNDEENKTLTDISFCFDKKDLSSINPTEYKYSITSSSKSCSNILDDDTYKLQEEKSLIYLEDIELKVPCSYKLKVSFLKKGSSDPAAKEVKTLTAKNIVIDSSTDTDKCIKIPFKDNEPPTTNPSSTSVIIESIIVD